MAMTLKDTTIGGPKLPPRIVAYGIDGIGKSSFGAQADKPIFICTEDGANNIDVPQFPLCKSDPKKGVWGWDLVFECLRSLATEEHDYKTVVVDTLDWGQHLAIEWIVANDYNGKEHQFNSFGKGYKVLLREWRKFFSALDYLRINKGMEVILLLHATIKRFGNPLGEDYDIYKAALVDTPSTSIWGLTKQWADLVLFMNAKIMVKTESDTATKGKAKMSQKRSIFSKPSGAYDAKVRAGWDLPDEFELDYEIFKGHLNSKKKKGKK